MRRRLVAVVCVAVVLATACGDDGGGAAPTTSTSSTSTTTTSPTTSSTTTAAPSTTSTTTVPARGFETEVLTATYVDESRITRATAETDEQPSRTIDVWIDRPLTDEPRPLVIFAHGLTGHPRSHEMLRRHLATEGFVVVSPAFPLTNNDVPGGFMNAGDTAEQVTDVSFLIDSVRADADLAPLLADGPVGMIGHSLGGVTTAGAALSLTTGDDRIGAAVVMSAGFGGTLRDAIPVMVLHGDADGTVPYESGVTAYAALTDRRMFVTLLGGDHIRGILDDDSDLGRAVRGLSAAFFADALGVEAGHVAALDAVPLAEVTIEAADAEGALIDWIDYFA